MSNIEIPELGRIINIFGEENSDSFVARYDFSRANLDDEHRILAITKVASICYQSPKALGSKSLYDRLYAESHGLPSSSFEFVPILIPYHKLNSGVNRSHEQLNIFKYGEIIGNEDFLLTNYRALVYDVENFKLDESWLQFYNTEEECEIIKENFYAFLFHVDLPTRAQMVRHRINWQELSRRYVSGKRNNFNFYISKKMEDVKSSFWYPTKDGNIEVTVTTEDVIEITLGHYMQALDDGIKPEEARRIITQSMMTQIWGGFQPNQLANFLKMRDDLHAQNEIQIVARSMKKLLGVG